MSDVSHFSITHYVYYWPDKRGCNHYQVVDSQTYEPCALDILERRGNRAVHTDTPPYSCPQCKHPNVAHTPSLGTLPFGNLDEIAMRANSGGAPPTDTSSSLLRAGHTTNPAIQAFSPTRTLNVGAPSFVPGQQTVGLFTSGGPPRPSSREASRNAQQLLEGMRAASDAIRAGRLEGCNAHVRNQACPDGVPHCHHHHSQQVPCHQPLEDCSLAKSAIRASFYNHNRWDGAPVGWNERHQACIPRGAVPDPRCGIHHQLWLETLSADRREAYIRAARDGRR